MGEKRYLLIKGIAGLGDRLMALGVATEYAKKTNRTCIIDWGDGLFSNPGVDVFGKFFNLKNIETCTIQEIEFEKISTYPCSIRNSYGEDVYKLFFPVRPKYISRFPTQLAPKGSFRKIYGYWQHRSDSKPRNDLKVLMNLFNKNDLVQGRNLSPKINCDLVVFVDMGCISEPDFFLNHLFLQDPIRDKVREFAQKNNLNKKTIGVHVRFTDKKPLKDIDLLISGLKRRFPNDFQIFLATDNTKVEDVFFEHFDKIIKTEKFLPQTELGGIHHQAMLSNDFSKAEQILIESIWDMWLLAECEYLFFLGNSSFSRVSSFLHPDKEKQFDWNKL